jgi:hypothetical protein
MILAIGCGGRSDSDAEPYPDASDGGRDVRNDALGERDSPRLDDAPSIEDVARTDGAGDEHAEDARDSGGSADVSDGGVVDAPFDSLDASSDRIADDADVRVDASLDALDAPNDIAGERDASSGDASDGDARFDVVADVPVEPGSDDAHDSGGDLPAVDGFDDAPISDAATVDACVACGLVSLTVTPPGATVFYRFTRWMSASGTYADGSTRDLTQHVRWSVSSSSLGHVSNRATTVGLLTGRWPGIVTVTAALGGVTGSADVTVLSGDPFMMKLMPPVASIAVGTQQRLNATAIFSDAVWQDWTSMSILTWSSSSPSVATVADGVVTAMAPGTTTITATFSWLTATATVTVTPAMLTSLSLEPTVATIPLGAKRPFRAIGHFNDGTTQDLTEQALWGSTNLACAVVSDSAGSKGKVSGVGMGDATITASYGGLVVTTTVTVAAPILQSLAVLYPPSGRLMMFFGLPMSAYGNYADGTSYDLTDQTTWTSSDPSIVEVSGRTITGVGEGTATVRATVGAVSGQVSVEVRAGALVSSVVTPNPASVGRGQSILFYLTGTYADGSTYDLTRFFPWYTTDPAIAWIGDPTGESPPTLTGVNAGTTNVIAFAGGSSAVTVTP